MISSSALIKDSRPRIAIIGAGISGLTTAWYLQRSLPDAIVHVFDSSDRVGGVIQSVSEQPFLVELGADNFATLVPDALRFVEEMGIRDEFISPRLEHRIAQVVRNGKVVPIPNGFSLMQPTQLSSVLTTKALSPAGKIRLLAEYFVKARQSDEDESVEAFAVRRLGRECFDRLIEPIVGGIFTARSETLSMQAAMPQFVAMEREHGGLIRAALAKRRSTGRSDQSARQATGARYDQFLAPKQGMSWWLNRIASDLRCEFKLNQQVRPLTKNPDQTWSITSKSTLHTNVVQEETYDGVCLALSSLKAAELLKQVQPRASTLLERIPYASSAVAVLAIKKSEIRPEAFCFGIVVPKIERRDCLAISLSSEKYDGRCPDDLVLARVFMGGAVRPELLEKSDDQLLAIAKKEVLELLGASSLPHWQSLVRWNEAMPQYMVGHTQLIASIREAMVADATLKLIGNGLDGVGIPQCVRLARQTAEQFAALLAI
jgi:oxygen-dependent protoporphyrinogen oxidase